MMYMVRPLIYTTANNYAVLYRILYVVNHHAAYYMYCVCTFIYYLFNAYTCLTMPSTVSSVRITQYNVLEYSITAHFDLENTTDGREEANQFKRSSWIT